MKQAPPSSSCPLPPHILPLPHSNNVITLATSSSSYSNYSNDKFTLPNNNWYNKSNSSSSSYETNARSSYKRNGNDSHNNNNDNGTSNVSVTTIGGRALCSDRKGFFDHLRPKSLILSVSYVLLVLNIQYL